MERHAKYGKLPPDVNLTTQNYFYQSNKGSSIDIPFSLNKMKQSNDEKSNIQL